MPSLSLRPASDEDRIAAVLREHDLPHEDLDSSPVRLFEAVGDGDRIGIGGLEGYGDVGLLRSVVVEEALRGRGFGEALCRALEDRARADGIGSLYLLSTDAAGFFSRLGYEEVDREAVPPAIAATEEFAELCPDTATAMRKHL